MSALDTLRCDESEEAVLATVVGAGDEAARALAELAPVVGDPANLACPASRLAYQALLDLAAGGSPLDRGAVANRLRAEDPKLIKLQKRGGLVWLYGLYAASVPLETGLHHARVVADRAARRRALEAIHGYSGAILDLHRPLAESQGKILSDVLAQTPGGEPPYSARELVNGACLGFRDRQARGLVIDGISIWLGALNEATLGLKPGNLITLGAGTGCGKSAFALQAASSADCPALIFSLEMSRSEMQDRLIVQEGGLDSARFATGQWSAVESCKMYGAVERLGPRQMYLARGESWDIQAIRMETIRWLARLGKPARSLVVIDYLQLVDVASDRRNPDHMNRERVVNLIALELKRLASATGCTVLALSQLNDDGEMRESRAIKQHSNQVWIIEQEGEGSNTFVLRMPKTRSIQKAKIRLLWNGPSVRFDEHKDQTFEAQQQRTKGR